MRVFVTGVKGQLGYDVMNELEKQGLEGIGVDIDEMDITDADQVNKVIKEAAPDAVIHCAAYTAVDAAEDNEEICRKVNAQGTENIAKVCEELDIKMMYISTDYVFNGNNHIPYTEDDITDPIGVYGKTKLAGEETIKKVGCNYIILRTAWLYSKWGNNFVKTMQKLTLEKDSLSVIFDQIGSPTYAKDLAHAISLIIERNMLNQQGIYHYSNEGVCSWFDFAKEICELSGHNCNITPIHSQEYPSKVTRPHYSVLDKTKFKETFGIPVPYWKDSLKKCINELKEMQL